MAEDRRGEALDEPKMAKLDTRHCSLDLAFSRESPALRARLDSNWPTTRSFLGGSALAVGGRDGPHRAAWGPPSAEFASEKACLLVACDSRLIRIGCEQQRALQLVPALQYPPTPSSVKFTERYLNKTLWNKEQ